MYPTLRILDFQPSLILPVHSLLPISTPLSSSLHVHSPSICHPSSLLSFHRALSTSTANPPLTRFSFIHPAVHVHQIHPPRSIHTLPFPSSTQTSLPYSTAKPPSKYFTLIPLSLRPSTTPIPPPSFIHTAPLPPPPPGPLSPLRCALPCQMEVSRSGL